MIPDTFARHAMLLQEPWCFSIEQVKRLTVWQVENLYLKPAEERAAATAMEMQGFEVPTVKIETGDLETFVVGMMQAFPETKREKWEADWNRMKLEERKNG